MTKPTALESATALVQGVRENDPAAKAAFFRRYAPRVDRVVRRVLGFDAERADILQDVFLGALTSIHTLKKPAAVEAWLSSVAALTARKVLRERVRRSRQRCFIDASEEIRYEPVGPGLDMEGRRALQGVCAVLLDLPVGERVAFTLHAVEGMNLTDIARVSGVSLSTVKRRLARVERRFIAHSQRHCPELESWVGRVSRGRSSTTRLRECGSLGVGLNAPTRTAHSISPVPGAPASELWRG